MDQYPKMEGIGSVGSNVVPFWLWLLFFVGMNKILPKKELHLSLWVGSVASNVVRFRAS